MRRMVASACVVLAASSPWLIGAGALAGAVLSAIGRRSLGLSLLAGSTATYWTRRVAVRGSANGGSIPHRGSAVDGGENRSVTVRLVSANLWNFAEDVSAIAALLDRTQADIVVLQEVTPWHFRRLEELRALEALPFRAVRTDPGHTGLGVWSRFVLSNVQWFTVACEPQVRAWTKVPAGPRLRIYAVHAPPPIPSKVGAWHRWFIAMAREVAGEVSEHADPVVIAGDFNATVDHRPFRALLRVGFVDSALAVRRGWRMTWPKRWRSVPALFRIDHVLLRYGIRVVRYRVGQSSGSDHRPLVVDLVLAE